jgi:hypothetical protein
MDEAAIWHQPKGATVDESIKTEAEYRQALKEVEGLMTAAPDTPEGGRLSKLVSVVEHYEQRVYGPSLESLLQRSAPKALSLTQEDREWLYHLLPSENGGRWDSWFDQPAATPDFLNNRDQGDAKDD